MRPILYNLSYPFIDISKSDYSWFVASLRWKELAYSARNAPSNCKKKIMLEWSYPREFLLLWLSAGVYIWGKDFVLPRNVQTNPNPVSHIIIPYAPWHICQSLYPKWTEKGSMCRKHLMSNMSYVPNPKKMPKNQCATRMAKRSCHATFSRFPTFRCIFWGLLSCLNMSAVHHSNHSLLGRCSFQFQRSSSSNSLTARKDSQDIPTLGSRDWIEGKFREPWVFLHPMIAFRCSFQPKN